MKKTPKLTLFVIVATAWLWPATPSFSQTPSSVDVPRPHVRLIAEAENDSSADKAASTDAQPSDESAKQPDDEKQAGTDNAASEQDARAREILEKAREKLSGPDIRTVTAKLQQQVSIGVRKLRADGLYLQATGSGDQRKIRIEFDYRHASPGMNSASIGSLLQVCDGQVLWTEHRVGKQSQITRRDVQQILTAAREAAGVDPSRLLVDLGLGGLPALLAALEQAMTFDAVKEDTLGDKSFLLIEGGWSDEYKKRVAAGGSLDQLPAHVPDKVQIYLEPELLFPRRIRYMKRPPGKDYSRPMVTLDFVYIELNAEIKDDQFEFVPPDGVLPRDVTKGYLQLIELQQSRQQQTTPGE